MMKEENNKMNEWNTDESVEWLNSGMIQVCKDVFMWWQNIGIRKQLSDQVTKLFMSIDLQLYIGGVRNEGWKDRGRKDEWMEGWKDGRMDRNSCLISR